jgi:hypothetical protein
MVNLLLTGLIVFIVNIPFGYWRANVKKLSLQWFLTIHIPVVIVIALRFLSHIGFAWYTYLVLVTAFVLGQQSGGLVIKKVRRICDQVSSCMVMDLYRCVKH